MRSALAIVLLLGCDVCPPLDRTEAKLPLSTADVAEMSSRGVVNIASSRIVSFDPHDSRFERDLLFRFFFGVPDEPELTIEQHQGSAVVISSDGYALTNNHLVEGVDEVRVTTASGEKLQAEIVGMDPETDLALLKLQGNLQSLTPIRFGDSDALRPGDVVVAVGNSFGLGQTVTAGVVSGKGRSDLGILAYEDFIQTDTAINPGNSGGALLNLRGELVGINTALLTKSGTFEGVGLAIPSKVAASVMKSLREDGRVIRAYLGAAAQDLDDKLAGALDLRGARGALISDVVPDSPASIAGLRPKDLISAIDGVPVPSARRFRTMIAEKEPDSPVVLEVLRDGKLILIRVVLIERPTRPVPTIKPMRVHLTTGVEGWTLDADTRDMLAVPPSFTTGLVVAKVRPGSPAWQTGLRPGDVLVSADEHTIETPEALDRLYTESDRPLLLRIVRRGTALFLALEPRRTTPES